MMSAIPISALAVLAGLAAAGLGEVSSSTSEAAPLPTAASPSVAETFYKCPSGYTFATNGGDSAHCKKAAYTTTAISGLAACPNVAGIGTFAKTDFSGNRDMCVGTNPVTGQVAVERGCMLDDIAAGYTKVIVSGTDRCEKKTSYPMQIAAPSVSVQR